MSNTLKTAAALTLATVSAAWAGTGDDKDPISDYVVDISPGNVSAADILGLPASAVTTLHAPKDFVAVLGGLTSDKSNEGFGVSFTPGRTSMKPVAVSISDYQNSILSRIWAGTTFSYAQNKQAYDSVDYKQYAVAIHGNWYLDKTQDPNVVAYQAFAGCKPAFETLKNAAAAMAQATEKARRQMVDDAVARQVPLQKAKDDAAVAIAALPPSRFDDLMHQVRQDARNQIAACAKTATDDAPLKWNASQLGYVLGAGWLRNADGSSPRLSLGRTATLVGAWGLTDNSLLNLTVKHLAKAIDTTTLATTPSYKRSNLVAARWTYGHGDTSGLFGLAEISNAKASQGTVESGAFKVAVGVDKRMFDGGWIEFRYGRRHNVDTGKDENVGLLSLKMTTGSTLPKAGN